jgi:hypothetical protein
MVNKVPAEPILALLRSEGYDTKAKLNKLCMQAGLGRDMASRFTQNMLFNSADKLLCTAGLHYHWYSTLQEVYNNTQILDEVDRKDIRKKQRQYSERWRNAQRKAQVSQ